MEHTDTNKNEPLINWSKWLITINLFSATGCVIALKTADQAKGTAGTIFFMAILCFVLSLVCSTLFVLLLSKPYTAAGVQKKYTWLASVQWILFVLGLIFVLAWIAFLSGMAG